MAKVRVGIIGGGWSGIYTAKYCQEMGLEPTVFEAGEQIGGQWLYQEDRSGGVREKTTTVSSKLYMSPSDFPYSEKMPEFLSATQVYEHFQKYVLHFDLTKYIQCQQKVLSVSKEDNEWVIETKKGKQTFDKVVIATGTNKEPKYPTDPMYEKFSGKIHHSHDIKKIGDRFKGKKVLIIGGSDTASDIACDLSENSDVTVSIRSGTWFQDRRVDDIYPELAGGPSDMVYSRAVDKGLRLTNYDLINHMGFVEWVEKGWGTRGSAIESWYTPAGYLNTYYTKSRHMVRKVHDGKISPARGVQDIKGHQVLFVGDKAWHTFDDIIFCTGYRPKLDFNFPMDMKKERFRKILSLEDDSVAYVGYIRPYVTSVVMLAEMQARWVADVFSKNTPLPSLEKRCQMTVEDESIRKKRFAMYADRMPFLVDPFAYMNTLAKDIKQYPNYLKLWVTEPRTAFHVFFDSWNHFAYLLDHADKDKRDLARKNILALGEHPIAKFVRGAPVRGIIRLFSSIYYYFKPVQEPSHASTIEMTSRASEKQPLLREDSTTRNICPMYQRHKEAKEVSVKKTSNISSQRCSLC